MERWKRLSKAMLFLDATSSRGAACCREAWPRVRRLDRQQPERTPIRKRAQKCLTQCSDARVSRLGIGCACVQRKRVTPDDVRATLHRALELGINYQDTAPTYGSAETGFAEEKMGPAIAEIRDKVWSRARHTNLGLVAMKVLGGAARDEGGFRMDENYYENAIRYSLSIPGIAAAVIGLENILELEKAATVVARATPLLPEESLDLARIGLDLAGRPEWNAPYGSPWA